MSKATDISPAVRKRIHDRDYRCIFCDMGYRMYKTTPMGRSMLQIMHYVPRSQGGMGIEQNLALGCESHHQMMDNGLYHTEMRNLMRDYLKKKYKDWDESALIYHKWDQVQRT